MSAPKPESAATVTRGAVRCSAWLGVGVIALLFFGGVAQARIRHRLPGSRKTRNRERSRESKYLQVVHPIGPVKAILWLLGRPWDDWAEPHWGPNGFFFQAPLDNTGLPLTTAGGARKNLSVSSWARVLLWHVRTQLAILSRETISHLCGRRGKGHRNPKMLRCNADFANALQASFFRALPTMSEAMQSLQATVSCSGCETPNELRSARPLAERSPDVR